MTSFKYTYKEGAEHFFTDGDEYSNPYDAGTIERSEFERGWVQALKRGGNTKRDMAIYLSKTYPNGLPRTKKVTKTTRDSYIRKKSGYLPEPDTI